ncbi:kynureninase [Coniophora puteana RWD-64-598 SS2]|uniref:Kynureninase n=1 Tax=Coniophora puteana (strain RWD-64-598) TaxID=741705 RepID=A0A5M3N0T8_CONPW|nr:kynureninase [Coniophora puteana RWD-64-598 SS2]EIW85030.1 kynureninase [Coniophora puteana RWD-64-598 SS2]
MSSQTTSLAGDEFTIPTYEQIGASSVPADQAQERCTYLCGNSLGPLPIRSRKLLDEELSAWATRAVEGHFDHPYGRNWTDIASTVTPLFAEIVGAEEQEVACMSTLTANLHLMLSAFYKPTSSRYKILCEAKAFPSDQYAFASQVRVHGYDPEEVVIELAPRPDEFTLREEDILKVIAEQGQSISVVIFSGVQYYTGQWFPMQRITKAAQEQGCICGWDLAHAVGNVPMSLSDWNVDFAVWCTYKYLNSGPGGIAGLFIHKNHQPQPQYAGWWGHDPQTRFAMPPVFSAIPGAQGFQQSNPSALTTASLLGALQVFKSAGMMDPIRKRSLELTAYLESKLTQSKFYIPSHKAVRLMQDSTAQSGPSFTIITPSDPESRGAQLSLLFLPAHLKVMQRVSASLAANGVIGDKREPDVIRLAPAPLYNTIADCDRAALCLENALCSLLL